MTRSGVLLATALLLASPAASGDRVGRPQAGDYCPLPKEGEVPRCLAPAQAQYSDFFAALERGELSDEQAAAVEQDLRAENAYLALSSLTYGYYRLAQRAAIEPDADPLLVTRLQQWNGLLSRAYEASDSQSHFRSALREAAQDLAEQAPPVSTRCSDGSDLAKCTTATELVVALAAIDRQIGTTGGLARLLERIFGGSE